MATAENTREKLLLAAGEIFAAKGYQDATVREICQAAEANLAAVNYHFGDKERLYIESVKQAHCTRTQAVPLPHWPADLPAAEKLHGFVLTMLMRMVGDPSPGWHMQLMMRELFQPTAACRELVRDFIGPHFRLLLEIIDDLAPAGTSQQKRQLIAFSVIGQCLHYRVARAIDELLIGVEAFAELTPPLLAEHITQFTLAALAALPRSTPKASKTTRSPSRERSP